MKLKCKPLSPKLGREVPYPYYASPGAAAMDLHACLDDDVTIQPGQRVMIPTGLAIALPDAGYVALIFARSGLGVKHGIVPANCVGVIDSDYRGEVKVALQNHGDQPYTAATASLRWRLCRCSSRSWSGQTSCRTPSEGPVGLAPRGCKLFTNSPLISTHRRDTMALWH